MSVLIAVETPQRAIALVVLVVVLVSWGIYVVLENRRSTKDIVGSFLEAPNRKAAPDDEVFEGPRLDRFLGWALVSMAVVALSLPLYWLGEPGRHTGSIRGFDRRSVKRGGQLFGPEHNGFNCARCHGADGGGGVATWTVNDYNADGTPKLDPATAKPVIRQVSWTAPRINNVALRYRADQIRNVLIYGRGGAKNNPMPAWGVKGGGPGTDQQIDDLVNYLKHWAIEKDPVAQAAYLTAWKTNGHDAVKAYEVAIAAASKVAQAEYDKNFEATKSDARKVVAGAKKSIEDAQKALADAKATGDQIKIEDAQKSLDDTMTGIASATKNANASDGEIVFNLNCARCHTSGYSYGEPKEQAGGYYGPALRGAGLARQFPDAADQEAFVAQGVADEQAYGKGGVNHWSGGGMPYFGNLLTPEKIKTVVAYERSLTGAKETSTK